MQCKAAYFLAPLAMDPADKGISVKIVVLEHRSGPGVMVKQIATITIMKEPKGKRVQFHVALPFLTSL